MSCAKSRRGAEPGIQSAERFASLASVARPPLAAREAINSVGPFRSTPSASATRSKLGSLAELNLAPKPGRALGANLGTGAQIQADICQDSRSRRSALSSARPRVRADLADLRSGSARLMGASSCIRISRRIGARPDQIRELLYLIIFETAGRAGDEPSWKWLCGTHSY